MAAGTDVSGLGSAALLPGRRLRSVPAAPLSDAPAKDVSDGGAAAGFAAGSGPATPQLGTDGPESAALLTAELALATTDLNAALALLESATGSAPEELAAANFLQAADFAELTEKLSRRVEHLQVLAAAAVDRTRTEAINAAATASRAAGWTTGWTTGWCTDPGPVPDPGAQPSEPAATTAGASGSSLAAAAAPAPTPAASASAVAWSPADDGARNTAEFLRTRLRISTPEARRRLALANATLPRAGLAGRPMPPEREETAAALTTGIISSRAGTTITTALDKVRHIPDPALITEMEHNLTQTAIENDHDFLTRIAHRWIDALDQDGTEPSEENLRHRQGVFLHHKRGGLHHLEIRATTDQYEVLTTVMNTATNPRTTTPNTTTCRNTDNGTSVDGGIRVGGSADGCTSSAGSGDGGSGDGGSGSAAGISAAAADPDEAFNAPTPEPDLDRRTLAQQRLDGLVGASKAALAAGTLPTTGGLRPQVMVTIGYRDLLNSIQTTANRGPRYAPNTNGPGTRRTDSPRPTPTPWQATINPPTGPDIWQTSESQPEPGTDPTNWQTSEPDTLTGKQPVTTLPGINWSGTDPFPTPRPGGPSGAPTGSGTFNYTGPVTASTIRKIACDADIIPVLLGSQGRILDIGRTTRIFPPHIRKALNARDQGCAFPNCTIPASWCEAHHITYWSRRGPTSTDNGVLLCTHHHHLIHKEQWKIRVKNGVPWFIPPPHIDPRQQPRQNHHHKT
ncbi:hypothetical protein ARGLB_027_01480 [Arthrobacter globiformis NBRC 12137]|uniref:HNH nuclease domain-containing protein n=1 Tax=Arthrobacter globiformis (strain ATCC 8010 / DSM 20124 / JCM 1332 / NBRC 12137 / NCIMB 8907 / NRRL B-2979 / 168) TaxID=1077972 RepID=H0QJ17_ARTG1|nr:HNH endonuclease signature motif containing protein [Arthrobacter globiformis]GAB12818.1 hypothetical protein ARGLB_027_01480 [Arthrobacter globiformis NBRC 12137]